MNNLKILECMGKGAQGTVYAVEHLADKRKYVLKMVECNDENEANKAYRECAVLKDLQHPYISTFRDFFVHWDKVESAMFVCFLSKFYPMGTLSKLIQEHRQEPDVVSQKVVKRAIGQIVEAVQFAHKKGIVHRDLKPNNVYLTVDHTVAVGDFGVPTVMLDVRMRTRNTPGSLNYMAPEVVTEAYSEKTDIWSIGCIALELVTCSVISDTAEMNGKLLEIKHNPEALDELLVQIEEYYTPECIEAIKVMLTRDKEERPSFSALMELPFIKNCLTASNTVKTNIRKKHLAVAKQRPVPTEGAVEDVVHYIQKHSDNPCCINQALEHLITLAKEDKAHLEKAGKRVLLKVMQEHINDEDTQVLSLRLFNHLVVSAAMDDVIYSQPMISAICRAMRVQAESAQAQQAGCQLLMGLSANSKSSDLIGQSGCIGDVTSAMRAFRGHVDVQISACGALWSLSVFDDNARIISEAGAVLDVLEALKGHGGHAELVESASSALLSLAMEDDNIAALTTHDAVGLLLRALRDHAREAKVVRNCCLAMSALVEPEEECAYRLLEADKEGKASLDEICAEVKYLKIGDKVLGEIHRRFKEDKAIMEPCEAALAKINGGKILLQ